ncbi:DUF116 domain-containing protein [Candidatus Woesearchaeota archaeon]|nr:DUF116 domain-containing protein [Candidatus Woesearchaeota archaeon]
MIKEINELNLEGFKKIPNNEKAIFLPQCLRSRECKAKIGDRGIECLNCGKCSICEFKKQAEIKGYNVFISPGGSLVKKIIKKNNFKGVLGVACIPELEQALDLIKKTNIIAISVPLSKDGCVDTDVDWKKVKELCGL